LSQSPGDKMDDDSRLSDDMKESFVLKPKPVLNPEIHVRIIKPGSPTFLKEIKKLKESKISVTNNNISSYQGSSNGKKKILNEGYC
jgi:hypothetical protein